MLQIKEKLQAKNECCKQKTNAANKKRTLQAKRERCKQKRTHHARHAAEGTGQLS